jgi:hypothetical protein
MTDTSWLPWLVMYANGAAKAEVQQSTIAASPVRTGAA